MDEEVKAKWVAALRSGKYKQGSGVLRTHDNRFCCLGVLADIVAPNEWHLVPKQGCYSHGGLTGFLPAGIAAVAGLDPMQRDGGSHQQRLLSKMNDRRTTFPEIATFIEDNL